MRPPPRPASTLVAELLGAAASLSVVLAFASSVGSRLPAGVTVLATIALALTLLAIWVRLRPSLPDLSLDDDQKQASRGKLKRARLRRVLRDVREEFATHLAELLAASAGGALATTFPRSAWKDGIAVLRDQPDARPYRAAYEAYRRIDRLERYRNDYTQLIDVTAARDDTPSAITALQRAISEFDRADGALG